MSVALIACSNGLGHVRRIALIAHELVGLGVEVTLFAPKRSVNKILDALEIPQTFLLTDFDTCTSGDKLRSGNHQSLYWEERLPDIGHFDTVVSDNLPEILAIRPDAWLSGNFFWHETLPDISTTCRQRAKSLLKVHHPTVLTYGPFSSIEDTNDLTIIECSVPQVQQCKFGVNRDALLITSGTGGEATSTYRDFIESLSQLDSGPFKVVFVEPDLLPKEPPHWMYRATFTAIMYSRLLATICRPGFGIISECLAHRIRMFLVFEDANREMENNSKSLALYGIGSSYLNCWDAFDAVTKFLESNQFHDFQRLMLDKNSVWGGPSAAELILGLKTAD